jgi:hypothetical protein
VSLEEETAFGGYGGLIWHVDDQTSLAVEYQATGNANAIGINLMHRFGQARSSGSQARSAAQRRTRRAYSRPDTRPLAAPKKTVKQKLKTGADGKPVKDEKGNFIFMPVEK